MHPAVAINFHLPARKISSSRRIDRNFLKKFSVIHRAEPGIDMASINQDKTLPSGLNVSPKREQLKLQPLRSSYLGDGTAITYIRSSDVRRNENLFVTVYFYSV